jgi:hypothetical protein
MREWVVLGCTLGLSACESHSSTDRDAATGSADARGTDTNGSGDGSEPACLAGTSGTQRFTDDFESPTGTPGAPWAATGSDVTLTTGRGGGMAVRCTYSPSSFAAAIEYMFESELPHVVVSYWYRTDPGFDPAADDTTGSGIKWFTLWRTSAGRQTWGVGKLAEGETTFVVHDNSSPDMPNAEPGYIGTLTSPVETWGATNDGAWHRFTIEAYTGTGTDGFERAWVDGVLQFDSSGTGYTRSTQPFALVKFPSDMVQPPAATHTIDIDDFVLCTP